MRKQAPFVTAGRRMLRGLRQFDERAVTYYGPRPTGYFRHVYYSLFRVNTFFVYRKDLTSEAITSFDVPECDIGSPPVSHLKSLRETMTLPREFYCDESHGWNHFVLVTKHDVPAHIHWIVQPGQKSRFFELSASSAEINYVYTATEFRGRRIALSALRWGCRHLREIGFRTAVLAVHEENVPCLKCVEQCGFIRTNSVVTVGHLNRRLAV